MVYEVFAFYDEIEYSNLFDYGLGQSFVAMSGSIYIYI